MGLLGQRAVCLMLLLGAAFYAMQAEAPPTEAPLTTLMSYLCNQQMTDNVDEKLAFDRSLFAVQRSTSEQFRHPSWDEYYHGTGTSTSGSATAYAKGSCPSGLPEADCFNCLVQAYALLKQLCVQDRVAYKQLPGLPYSRGARVELSGCHLRVEFFPFS